MTITRGHFSLQTITVHLKCKWSRPGNLKARNLAKRCLTPECGIDRSWTLARIVASTEHPSASRSCCFFSWEPSWAQQLVKRVSRPSATTNEEKKSRKSLLKKHMKTSVASIIYRVGYIKLIHAELTINDYHGNSVSKYHCLIYFFGSIDI